jgi:hypothetical protein
VSADQSTSRVTRQTHKARAPIELPPVPTTPSPDRRLLRALRTTLALNFIPSPNSTPQYTVMLPDLALVIALGASAALAHFTLDYPVS